MPYRVVDLAYSAIHKRIEDAPLQEILSGHQVDEAREHFYEKDGVPHLLVSILYSLAPLAAPPNKQRFIPRESVHKWKEILNEESLPLFEKLREWRNTVAKEKAVPAYLVLNNVQLARVANERPRSFATLQKVPGIGKGKIDSFGASLLQYLTPKSEVDTVSNGGSP